MKSKTLEEKMLHYFRTAGSADGEYKEPIPSFVRFAHRSGTDMQTLRAKREKSKSFARAWSECEDILADRIIEGALCKRFDASFSKFLLSARFGYTDKKEDEGADSYEIAVVLKEPEGKEEDNEKA